MMNTKQVISVSRSRELTYLLTYWLLVTFHINSRHVTESVLLSCWLLDRSLSHLCNFVLHDCVLYSHQSSFMLCLVYWYLSRSFQLVRYFVSVMALCGLLMIVDLFVVFYLMMATGNWHSVSIDAGDGGDDDSNNNNKNNNGTMCIVLSSWHGHCMNSCVSLDRWPSDQTKQLDP